jgi:hypothetical protein
MSSIFRFIIIIIIIIIRARADLCKVFKFNICKLSKNRQSYFNMLNYHHIVALLHLYGNINYHENNNKVNKNCFIAFIYIFT